MSTTRITTDGTISLTDGAFGSATVVGAGSAHAALADADDATYVAVTGTGSAKLDFGSISLPAGAVVKSVNYWLRTAVDGLNSISTTFTIAGKDRTTSMGINWTSPSTAVLLPLSISPTSEQVNSATCEFHAATAESSVFVYRAFVDVAYVVKPVTVIDRPSGVIEDTNSPRIAWSNTLDPDGGDQVAFQVVLDRGDGTRVITFLGDGFANSYETSALADGAYVAYVRVAQAVNGVLHWSDWVHQEFTIDVDLPAVPLLLAEPDPGAGWIALEAYAQPGDATTDLIEIERSADDGATWQTIRTKREDGRILSGEGPIDWEAPIGVPLVYRVRAVHDYSGVYASSEWETTAPMVLDTGWWLRHPLNPGLALAVNVHSFKTTQRGVRQAVHNPVGRAAPVIVSDVRGLLTATVILRTDTPAERAKLDELLDSPPPLLLRGPAADDWIDSYVAVGDTQRERLVDKAFVAERLETLPITVVDRPTDVATTWPDAMLLEHWLIADGGDPDLEPPDELDGGTP